MERERERSFDKIEERLKGKRDRIERSEVMIYRGQVIYIYI